LLLESKKNNSISPITTSFWPPLSSDSTVQEVSSGYQGDYKKYTKEQIVAVFSNIKGKLEKEEPKWEKKVAEVMVEGRPLLYSEILKTVPKDAKVECIDVGRQASYLVGNQKPEVSQRDYKNKALRAAQTPDQKVNKQQGSQDQQKPSNNRKNAFIDDGTNFDNQHADSNQNETESDNNNFVTQGRSGRNNKSNQKTVSPVANNNQDNKS